MLGLKLRRETPNPGLLETKLRQTDRWDTNVAGECVCVCVCVCVWVTSVVKALLGNSAECQMPSSLRRGQWNADMRMWECTHFCTEFLLTGYVRNRRQSFPCPRHEGIVFQLHSFLSSALYGGDCSTPRPGLFTSSKENRYPLNRTLRDPQNLSGRSEEGKSFLKIMHPLVCCTTKKQINKWPSNTTTFYEISIQLHVSTSRGHYQASFRTF